ncbi:hypothetical protein Krac_8627 [Ktedonobacter racemifer DSM 44963]|uniref:Uncharacterized protein n=1 Tax=Ktedonobacter racemifer DSM 44963 TaxID=485913 RepID=D6TNG6_KTERA|nr:hypothetical protein Krac_8627 [Ktedonobacter racemifer DSM 44963]
MCSTRWQHRLGHVRGHYGLIIPVGLAQSTYPNGFFLISVVYLDRVERDSKSSFRFSRYPSRCSSPLHTITQFVQSNKNF